LGHRTYNAVYRQKHNYRTTPINSVKFKTLLGGCYDTRALSIMQNTHHIVFFLIDGEFIKEFII